MDIAKEIERVSSELLTDGTLDRIIRDQIEKTYKGIVEDAFRSYGTVGKLMREKIDESMLKSVDSFEWDKYIPKLDSVLVELINKTPVMEQKKVLDSFYKLMITPDKKEVTVSELFGMYGEIVAENVDCDGREVYTDDGEPEYESVEIVVDVESLEDRPYSIYERKIIHLFTDDTDDNNQSREVNVDIPVSRWKESNSNGWNIEYVGCTDINSLRYISDLEVMVMKLARANTKIVIDIESDSNCVTPTQEPEASWS